MASIAVWEELYAVRITTGWFPALFFIATLAALIVLSVTQMRRHARRRLMREWAAALAVGGVGGAIVWFISDGIVLFGVELGWDVIISSAIGFLVLGFFIAAAVAARGWRRVLAIVMVPLTFVTTAVRINMIYGEYQTIGSLVDYSPYPYITASDVSLDTVSIPEWNRDVDAHTQTPAKEGRLLSADIANPASKFAARKALVWLPPSALAKRPPRLPVIVMLAGQPGSPTRYFTASNTIDVLTRYAHAHNGLAPIVVSPDQNTSMTRNSLCADTVKYGNAETYLTKDVPDWIRTHLPVSDDARDWTIGGFSQGGTCSTQIGPNHPLIYGNVLAVDGELAPNAGGVDAMVDGYFGGDRAAYERQVPVNALRAHAPSDQLMILAAGEKDVVSMANIATIGNEATKAGWTVVRIKAKGAGHDWRAVNATLDAALPWLCDRMGLAAGSGRGKDEDDGRMDTMETNPGIEVLR
ncbi:alpha/beta hydrolase [Bifidobacterium criceti]|uniref:Esterase n=1 Tax=Bifidobacterium criceti TaxID=1960969 RepID=A0A2A2EH59_9BIFI|nr:alpha/beta hydrolase-fold protein [Bifidobacterium criceti]PAU68255.1 esterase [Bifidobacterium criceti]